MPSSSSTDRTRQRYGTRICARSLADRSARAVLLVLLFCGALSGATLADDASDSQSGTGWVLRIPLSDAIGPVTARFVVDQIAVAEKGRAEAAILELDTPGGLDTSMREMVKAILGATVPVVVYVGPSGARAASAGLYITMAAPVAAMAPGTNIGAATPVGLGGGAASPDSTMEKKVVNDAVAYVRSLAERHGRNAEWGEQAVRDGASVSAERALELGVIDLIADNFQDLLVRLDGRTVSTALGEHTLRTAQARVEDAEMTGRDRALALLSNPSLAYLLLLAGILGIALELYNPGAILPGVVGGISLILAFFALQQLPVNVAGLLLILLAVVLFVLEVKVPSYGILSVGGVTSLILGSLFLFKSGSFARIGWGLILPTVVAFSGFFLFVVTMAARAQRRRKLSGAEGMVGEIGLAKTALAPQGRVDVHGELWNATATEPVAAGDQVRVRRVSGLALEVEPWSGSRFDGQK
ncbi:MAG: nodulation protein NfeD [Candidatus Eisenbacteria bacterium]